mmetsp:Transcript_31086/g.89145  ORF Transcript_31086/g.89145 Transcript_31086/m.89145 type:complete len:89 (-) Transcript_31086:2617-2883(-)
MGKRPWSAREEGAAGWRAQSADDRRLTRPSPDSSPWALPHSVKCRFTKFIPTSSTVEVLLREFLGPTIMLTFIDLEDLEAVLLVVMLD